MFYALIAILCVASLFQRDAGKRKIACFYSLMTVLHILSLGETTGLIYYGSAALFDFIILMVIIQDTKNSRLVTRLSIICLVEIVCNSIGYVMWFAYVPSTAYNITYLIIYLIIIAIFTLENIDVGGNKSYRRNPCSRTAYSKGGVCSAKIYPEEPS